MKINGGGERRGKGKAIIGIALAAIMLASIIVAISARDANGAIELGDVVYRGEHSLDVSAIIASGGTFYGMANTTADGGLITVADNTNFAVPTMAYVGPYNVTSGEGTVADIIVDEPAIIGDVFIEGTNCSIVNKSIPVGTRLTIRACPNFGGLLKEAGTGNWGKIKLILIDPDGIWMVKKIDADASEIDITPDDWHELDTSWWDTGTWKVKIVSDKATCNEVDVSSPEYEFTVCSEALSIEAKEDVVGLGEDIILTVTGYFNHYYYFAIENVVAGEEPQIEVTGDIVSLGTGEGSPSAATAAWIKTGSDGIADIKISTYGVDKRTYTMHVYDTYHVADAVPNETDEFAAPAGVTGEKDDDDVDVEVTKPGVTFDIPPTAIIGDDVTIKGTITAGDKVDILIEDGDDRAWDDEPVDENDEFEVVWDTDELMTGTYTIDVYIDCPYDAETTAGKTEILKLDEDGRITIRLVEPGLTAEQLRNVVAEDDDYTVEGTATGVDDVDIVLIGPNGYPLADPGLDVFNGLEILSTSVINNEFSEDITMTEGLDLGTGKTMVFSPGRDGTYGDLGVGAGELAEGIDQLDGSLDGCYGSVANKTQAQIVAILEDNTVDVAGSDDDHVDFTFEVETPYVSFDPIESVTIGEPLEITGKTNREPGTMIVIYMIEGPTYLPADITEVEWPTPDQGIFNATIDTTYAVAGNYTLRADDGDWNTDTATVEILPAISIFDTEAPANPYPSIMGTHNGTITPSCNINVSKLYTYSCVGTGGHTESIELYDENDVLIANGTWNGYVGDWHNITLHNLTGGTPYVTLLENLEYNYTIITGSYPQIHHNASLLTPNGWINCTSFVDANGKKYDNWIPAIRLE